MEASRKASSHPLARDPETLRRYLLGEEYSGSGLLRRVERRVRDLSHTPGPGSRTGSIMATGSSRSENEGDSGQIERVLELAVFLVEWEAGKVGRSSLRAQGALFTYLSNNKLTDVAYLLGFDDIGEEPDPDAQRGKLWQIRQQVKELLRGEVPASENVARCQELVIYLTGWIGGCLHRFEEDTTATGTGYRIFTCDCGAKYMKEEGGSEQWLAI